MDAAFDQCRAIVRTSDRDRYLATLFAPAEHRGALYALYAFDDEIGSIRSKAREPMPGEIRLQWWRDILQGGRAEEAAAHPVAAAILATRRRYDLPPEPMEVLIDAHGFDLYDDPMGSVDDLQSYVRRSTSAIVDMAARVLSGRRSIDAGMIDEAGLALGYTSLLQAFPAHSARRQIFVPSEILGHFGADPADAVAGKATPQWRAALAEMRLRARRHLDRAGERAAAAPPAILPALLPVALVRPALLRMERGDYDPFRPDMLPAWRRQWILWRAARRPQRLFR